MGLFAGEDGDIVSNARFYYRYIAQGADPGVLTNWTNDFIPYPHPALEPGVRAGG